METLISFPCKYTTELQAPRSRSPSQERDQTSEQGLSEEEEEGEEDKEPSEAAPYEEEIKKPCAGDRYIDPWGDIHIVQTRDEDDEAYIEEDGKTYLWNNDNKWREEGWEKLQQYARLEPERGQNWVYTAGTSNEGEEFVLRWDEKNGWWYVVDTDLGGNRKEIHYDPDLNNWFLSSGVDSDWTYTRKMCEKE